MARRKQQTAAAPAAVDPPVVALAPPVDSAPLVECAVLHDCEYGKHDEIVMLAPATAEAAAKANCVDPHPNAIKAIRSRG
jgi:hypothetical protein